MKTGDSSALYGAVLLSVTFFKSFFFPAVLHMSSLEPEEDEICSQGLEKEEEEEGCVLML